MIWHLVGSGTLDIELIARHLAMQLPALSSRSHNCHPTFPPSCWASPGWRQ
jgi:hypothetical protein